MDEDGGVPPRMIDVDESLHEAYRRLARAQSGDEQREAAAGLRSRQVAGVTAMMQIQERMRLAWPEGLAVPAEAPLTAWPYRLGDPDRYTHSWTAGNGYSWAQHADGAFLAAAYAPPRSGACQVDSEAGIGIQHHATRDGRVVVRPRLSVQSRFGWVAHPDTTEAVVVDTQLDTWLYVGAYALDPSSLRWAIDPANPWSPRQTETRVLHGTGDYRYFTGFTWRRDVLADLRLRRGTTYLVAAILRARLTMTTTGRDGRHLDVTGDFSTWVQADGILEDVLLQPV
ncbi:hypothetical protein [Janibacter melonis]|uniref:hypothetical protein n=1 Tax=Janibacter melonis TaxID=262209 RepID=UPI002094B01C|nr:hypothetical protein [Janibacter melonis]